MGWNAGYKVMEKTVISLYDKGQLTPELLDTVMEPYKETDCDSGGSEGLLAHDGLDVEQVICKTMKPKEYEDAIQNPVWAEGYEPGVIGNNEKYLNLFDSIWRDMWGIW